MQTSSNSITPKTVGDTFASARALQSLTQEEMGTALGVSKQAISRFEKNIDEPTATRVAEWFNDEREWVHLLAVEIFVARYRATIISQKSLMTTAV